MKTKDYTVTPFWDKGAKKPDGTSRIMITINLNRQQFRVTVKLRSTKEAFTKSLNSKGGSDEVKELRKELNHYIEKAELILDRLTKPDKESFLRLFKSEFDLSIANKTDALIFFKAKRDTLLKQNKFGSANNTLCAWYSFKNYMMWLKDGLSNPERDILRKNPSYKEPIVNLYFEDINAKFISDYTHYMINRDSSQSTIGMYLRALRGLYNSIVKDGLISDKNNPFKDLTLGWTEKSKEVLYPEHLKALWEYQPIGLWESRGKAFFFFCYLCNGMNFKDVAQLKYKNIKGNSIVFVRQKTRETKRVVKEIKVYLHDEVKKIIEDYGSVTKRPDDYIFPMFNTAKDLKHHNSIYLRYKKVTNASLKKIGRKLGFDTPINLGLARHSFATKHKLSGTPIAFISEALGHSGVHVTEHYIKSSPDENLKVMSDSLLVF